MAPSYYVVGPVMAMVAVAVAWLIVKVVELARMSTVQRHRLSVWWYMTAFALPSVIIVLGLGAIALEWMPHHRENPSECEHVEDLKDLTEREKVQDDFLDSQGGVLRDYYTRLRMDESLSADRVQTLFAAKWHKLVHEHYGDNPIKKCWLLDQLPTAYTHIVHDFPRGWAMELTSNQPYAYRGNFANSDVRSQIPPLPQLQSRDTHF